MSGQAEVTSIKHNISCTYEQFICLLAFTVYIKVYLQLEDYNYICHIELMMEVETDTI